MNSVNTTSHREIHRANEDRRSFETISKFPMINIKGKIIQKDRRHIPDRRIGNIEVAEYDSEIIDVLFKQGIFNKE